jgi:hypothetical protein
LFLSLAAKMAALQFWLGARPAVASANLARYKLHDEACQLEL